MDPVIVPSVLAFDFGRLTDECAAFEQADADRLQWDVMDGVFVPNITFGADVIASCRDSVSLDFEAHIMCERPEELLDQYVDAGCQWIILHPETLRQPHRTYQRVKELGARLGVALSPATPLTHVEHVMDLVDMILVMTVSPGFGGQRYLASMEGKIRQARAMVDDSGRAIDVEVDGGINADSIAGAAASGANVFVSGSGLGAATNRARAVADLRARAHRAATAG